MLLDQDLFADRPFITEDEKRRFTKKSKPTARVSKKKGVKKS